MRQLLSAGGLLFCLLSSITTSAQFNVNSLFAPIDFRLQLNLYESVTGTSPASFVNRVPEDSAKSFAGQLEEWKNWSYVENYEFGKDRGSIPMITDLNSLHPFFRDQVTKLIAKCKSKGIELAIVETYRTHAKQHEYKTMGRNYTTSKAGQSKHQYGLAVDVVPVVNSKPVWNNATLWRKIGAAGEKLGLRWGGRWRDPYDPGHFEWTGGLTSRHLSAGKFPTRPEFAERYPCLEEDLKILQSYWTEWETSQSAWTLKNQIDHSHSADNSAF
jgi:hypothetical protein